MTAAEYLKYGAYLCKYYNDEANEDCSDECPFRKRNQEIYKSTGKWSGAFCVFPEFNDDFDLDFALATVEEFKRKLESQNIMTYKEYALLYFPDIKLECVCPKDLFGKKENLIRACATNNGGTCDNKCLAWNTQMKSAVLKEVENVFNN